MNGEHLVHRRDSLVAVSSWSHSRQSSGADFRERLVLREVEGLAAGVRFFALWAGAAIPIVDGQR
jgi:hypothetical protein